MNIIGSARLRRREPCGENRDPMSRVTATALSAFLQHQSPHVSSFLTPSPNCPMSARGRLENQNYCRSSAAPSPPRSHWLLVGEPCDDEAKLLFRVPSRFWFPLASRSNLFPTPAACQHPTQMVGVIHRDKFHGGIALATATRVDHVHGATRATLEIPPRGCGQS